MNSTNNKNSALSEDKKKLLELMLKRKGVSVATKSTQAISKTDRNARLALSYGQQQLWFLEKLESGTPAYVFCNAIRFTGRLNPAALDYSINKIIERHEILRTIYAEENGIPYQIILEKQDQKLDVQDVSNLSRTDRENKIEELAVIEAKTAFDIEKEACIRTKLLKCSAQDYVLLLTMHHIVFDGWSLGVLFNELTAHYLEFNGSQQATPLLDIQYADYAKWQREWLKEGILDKQLVYWKQQLAGELPVIKLPTDRSRPSIQSFNGSLYFLALNAELTNALKIIARKHECTLFMVLFAAFNVFLARYSGQDDIIVGSPIASRNKGELENLIGFFVNTLVLRSDLSGDIKFSELLSRTRKVTMDAYANQDVPFEILVETLKPERDLSYNPIYQVMFALQNTPPPSSQFAGMDMTFQEIDSGTALFDLTLNMWEQQGEIQGYFEFNTDLFDQSTIERMAGHFTHILNVIAQQSDIRVKQYPLLNASEYNLMVNDWNNTATAFDEHSLIHEFIENCATEHPHSIAIICKGARLSFDALNKQANQLALYLRTMGANESDFIGICLERSTEMFVSILAVLKAGCAYAPIDPDYPNDRKAHIINDTGCSTIVTNSSHEKNLPLSSQTIICLDKLSAELQDLPASNLAHKKSSDSLAYIIYTSGSTGTPKGVEISHRNLVHSTQARMKYYPDKVSGFLLLSSFSFDSSIAGIFWALCQAGSLILPEQGEEKDVIGILTLLAKNQASHLLCLPSLYNVILAEADKSKLTGLKAVIVAGEACPAGLVNRHYAKLTGTKLYNEYGPTEGTVWASVYETMASAKSMPIPIGKPIPNMKIYILDSYLNPVPVGVPGEIFIAGVGISAGYHNNPELTAEKFLQNPFDGKHTIMYRTGDLAKYLPDGNIEFFGRIDNQVKIRGFRIELGEIETVISQYTDIDEVVVVTMNTAISTNTLDSTDSDITDLLSALDMESAYRVVRTLASE